MCQSKTGDDSVSGSWDKISGFVGKKCCSNPGHRKKVDSSFCSTGCTICPPAPAHGGPCPTRQIRVPGKRLLQLNVSSWWLRRCATKKKLPGVPESHPKPSKAAGQGRKLSRGGKITWNELCSMEANMLSYPIRAKYYILPSPKNLNLWMGQDPACSLCAVPANIKHIFVGCKISLTQGRHT